jgi:hypothetical protein
MDRIPHHDNNIELHKSVHNLMSIVFKSMNDRLSGAKQKLQAPSPADAKLSSSPESVKPEDTAEESSYRD